MSYSILTSQQDCQDKRLLHRPTPPTKSLLSHRNVTILHSHNCASQCKPREKNLESKKCPCSIARDVEPMKRKEEEEEACGFGLPAVYQQLEQLALVPTRFISAFRHVWTSFAARMDARVVVLRRERDDDQRLWSTTYASSHSRVGLSLRFCMGNQLYFVATCCESKVLSNRKIRIHIYCMFITEKLVSFSCRQLYCFTFWNFVFTGSIASQMQSLVLG